MTCEKLSRSFAVLGNSMEGWNGGLVSEALVLTSLGMIPATSSARSGDIPRVQNDHNIFKNNTG